MNIKSVILGRNTFQSKFLGVPLERRKRNPSHWVFYDSKIYTADMKEQKILWHTPFILLDRLTQKKVHHTLRKYLPHLEAIRGLASDVKEEDVHLTTSFFAMIDDITCGVLKRTFQPTAKNQKDTSFEMVVVRGTDIIFSEQLHHRHGSLWGWIEKGFTLDTKLCT